MNYHNEQEEDYNARIEAELEAEAEANYESAKAEYLDLLLAEKRFEEYALVRALDILSSKKFTNSGLDAVTFLVVEINKIRKDRITKPQEL